MLQHRRHQQPSRLDQGRDTIALSGVFEKGANKEARCQDESGDDKVNDFASINVYGIKSVKLGL